MLKKLILGTSFCALFAGSGLPAFAQIDEIIVEARKRQESIQDVPVIALAFDRKTLDAYVIDSIDDLSDLTPGLTAFQGQNGAGNSIIALRGVSAGDLNAAFSQPVAVNVDGIQLQTTTGLRNAQIDMQQVEVLKGPQALFFGKNSTGGIISIRSADPTDELFIQGRGSYEFNAKTKIGEIIVSAPITESLGARGVIYFADSEGWLTNDIQLVPGTFPTGNEGQFFEPLDRTIPDFSEVFGRLTLVWEPTESFSARLKGSYSDFEGFGANTSQIDECGTISPTPLSVLSFENCQLDDKTTFIFADTEFVDSFQTLASLEMNYNVTDALTITSVTGYHETLDSRAFTAVPTELLLARTEFDSYTSQVTQEVRLASDFNSPINFMVGGFYEDSFVGVDNNGGFIPFFGGVRPAGFQKVETSAYSLFAQATFDVTDTVEVSAGVRYSNETKEFDGFGFDATFTPGDVVPLIDERKFDNVSPEYTVTWRPQDNLTFFAAWKEGFKSGGFEANFTQFGNLITSPGTIDISFDQEQAEGGEFGAKSTLFNNTLRLNAAAYWYSYTGLQLTNVDATVPGFPAISVESVGAARVRGIELDALWAVPQIEGLTLQGAVNFNEAEYTDYDGPCGIYALTFGECDDPLNGIRSFNGEQLRLAPEWTGTVGISIDRPFGGSSLRYRGNVNGQFSSSYEAGIEGDPRDRADGYFQTNLSVGIYDNDRGWALDFIGKNVTDEQIILTSRAEVFLSNGAERTVNLRPRELTLQLTIRPMDLIGK